MTNISNKVLDELKSKKIKPIQKWKFLLKNYVLWIASVLAIILGSISFSVILYQLISNDWDIYKYLDKTFAGYVLLALPYFWIIFLILFVFIAFYNYKHITGSYRYKAYLILIFSILISMILGIIFFYAGLGSKIDQVFSQSFPFYFKMRRGPAWNQPEHGLLTGKLIKMQDNNNFFIQDCNIKDWKIKTNEKTIWKPAGDLQLGEELRMIGEKINEEEFYANEIRRMLKKRFRDKGLQMRLMK